MDPFARHSRYLLKFPAITDVENDVISKLSPQLINLMWRNDLNLRIIIELESLLLFDHIELEAVRNFNYQTETQRMAALFDVIRKTRPTGIVKCLEKLCDLSDQRRLSERIREMIKQHYPGCLTEQ